MENPFDVLSNSHDILKRQEVKGLQKWVKNSGFWYKWEENEFYKYKKTIVKKDIPAININTYACFAYVWD